MMIKKFIITDPSFILGSSNNSFKNIRRRRGNKAEKLTVFARSAGKMEDVQNYIGWQYHKDKFRTLQTKSTAEPLL